MIKNIKQDRNNDNQSENIRDDSLSEDDDEPLINLDILLNNGKNEKLSIYKGDNIKEKVKQFCELNRIFPKEEKVLLQRVNEELEIRSNATQKAKNKFDYNSINKTVKQPNEIENLVPKFTDYIPEEKKKLEHILNESESFSISESVKQSNNKLDNLMKEYKSDSIKSKYNGNEKESILNQGNESQGIIISDNIGVNKTAINNINANNNKIYNNNIIYNNKNSKLYNYTSDLSNTNKNNNNPELINTQIKPQIIYQINQYDSNKYNYKSNNINNFPTNFTNISNHSNKAKKIINSNYINKENNFSNINDNIINSNKQIMNKHNNVINPNNFNNSGLQTTKFNNTYKNFNSQNYNIIDKNNNVQKETYPIYNVNQFPIQSLSKKYLLNKNFQNINYNSNQNIINTNIEPILITNKANTNYNNKFPKKKRKMSKIFTTINKMEI